ncbi:HET-domain-containing protein [Glonium stellatum]|uniref:HET-domain-containing protein n=1 Tax=Glonium stellatum TaxID=574774 RepID=A0A8E2JUP7_9PEZI|nr:HET-domain-containing protein [Glonium stellatum]
MDHRYKRLLPGTIRLLSLLPGQECEPLSGRIFVAPVGESSYEALSYVWGNPSFDQELKCECGDVIKITPSLAGALIRLRNPRRARTLWIDQICINQGDEKERSSQVNMMGRIYESAIRVVMWLGDDAAEEAQVAFNFIQEIAGRADQIFDETPVTDQVLLENGLPEKQSSKWSSMRNLLSLPYWDRIWIVQEVVLAPDAITCWGREEIPWKQLWTVVKWAYSGSLTKRSTIIDNGSLVKIGSLGLSQGSLWDWLIRTKNRKATDERDRIYGLLGLIEEKALIVDYSKQPVEVFRDAAALILRGEGNLDVLSKVHFTPNDWPSWIPNWHDWDNTLTSKRTQVFQPDTRPVTEKPISVDGMVLSLAGVELGLVQIIGQSLDLSQNEKEHRINFIERFKEACSLAAISSGRRLTDQSLLKEIIRTFLCGITSEADALDCMTWVNENFLVFAQYWAFCMCLCIRYGYLNAQSALGEYLIFSEIAFSAYQNAQKQSTSDTLKQHSNSLNEWREWTETILSPHQLDEDVFEKAVNSLCVYMGSSTTPWGFQEQYWYSGRTKRFFILENGSFGMGPIQMLKGDRVVILFGGKVPYCLRQTPTGYRLIGECYVDQAMTGETIEILRKRWALLEATQKFELI